MDKIIVSYKASKALTSYLESRYDVIYFQGSNLTYEAIHHHVDVHMFYDGQMFYTKGIIQDGIQGEGIGFKYPDTVKYNVAKVGNYIIGNEAYTADVLKDHFKRCGYEWINVKQGYAKCSIVIVDDQSIITSDKGIYKACKPYLDVLLVEPGHVELEGMDFGFIGGCSFSNETIVFFNGNLMQHPSYDDIIEFIEGKHKTVDYIEGPLIDLGSFIIKKEVMKC